MAKRATIGSLFIVFLLFLHPLAGSAKMNGEPVLPGGKLQIAMQIMATDTVPGKPVPDNTVTQKKDDVIKEVPKARKQEKPVAVVPITIKPVVVKPKVVIRPIIKIH